MDSKHEPGSARAEQTPYVGLSHYTEDRADVFFGRDAERGLIIGNLRAARLTLLYAQSGVGKSSLLRAGVAARLRALAQRSLAQRGSAGYVPVVFSSWRDEPTQELVSELRAAIKPFVTDPVAEPPDASLEETIQWAATAANATLLVILDQFEEYFLYGCREAHANRFANELAGCLARSDLRANFLIAVREDAYAGLGDLFRGQVSNLYGNYLHLEYLDLAAARKAIVGPVDRFNATHPQAPAIAVEPELTDAVLEQVRTGRVTFDLEGKGALAAGNDTGGRVETPFLQLVMSALWEHEQRAGSRALRLSTLAELGGAERIVHSHLDDAMRELPSAERDTAVEVFNHLVTPSGTKIAHTVSDLAGYSRREPTQVQALVGRLTRGDRRILRPVPAAPGEEGQPRVEIFHDVLAPAILSWRAGEASARLEREKQIAEARAGVERRRARAFRAMAVVSLALLAIAILAAVLAHRDSSRAVRARDSELSGELTADALPYLQNGPVDRGVLLSLEAYRRAPTDQARFDLVRALQVTAPMVAYLRGHAGDVTSVAYSPDGRLIASAGAEGAVLIQNVETGRTVRLLNASSAQMSVAFDPNGKLLASAGQDGTVAVWNVATGRVLMRLRADSAAVYTVAFSSDGTTLASGGADDKVILWDTRTGHVERVLRGHKSAVNSVAFSSDGRTLASGNDDRTVILWNGETGRRLREFREPGAVNTVAFAPDGQSLASGGDDDTVTLWSVLTGRRLMVLHGHTNSVDAVAYSADGRSLASASEDGTVRVWALRTGRSVQILRGHFAEVETVAFDPAGGTLASGGDDHHVIVWEATPRLLERALTDTSTVASVAFSPIEPLLAAGAGDGTVSLWRFDNGAPAHVLHGSNGAVESIAFSPNGRTLALGNQDDTVTLRNAATGARIRTLRGHTDFVYSVAFSPDGHTLASGSADNTVILWNVATGEREHTLRGHSDFVNSVAFSPDGRTLASASADQTIILWDVASGRRLHTLRGHTEPVTSVAFSPDGRTLASGSDDRTVILWDARTGRRIGDPLSGATGSVLSVAFTPNGRIVAAAGKTQGAILWDVRSRLGFFLNGHTARIENLTFSPNGRSLATASLDGTVGLSGPPPSSVPFGAVQARLCGVVGRSLTRAEWNEFLPGQPYRRTCVNS